MQKIPFLKIILLLTCLALSLSPPILAQEDGEEEVDSSSELVEEDGAQEDPQILGGGAININIQPVAEGELDCEGAENGVQLQRNPADCLFFFLCIEGQGHKIECPKIPYQTYFNPYKKSCGSVSETYCLEVDYDEVLASFAPKEEEHEEDALVEEEGDGEGDEEDYDFIANAEKTEL